MAFKNHIMMLDDSVYRVSGSSIETMERFEDVVGDKIVVIDFETALTRVMTIEAPVKYAEPMVIRKLQEEGEFDESVQIITHWKRKRGERNTQIFFTAVSSNKYMQFIDQIAEHEDTVIFFPLFAVLYNFFIKLRAKEPVAVVFRHDRFADLLIGTGKQVYFASRCTAFDTTPEQIDSLWEMVSQDIGMVERENQITVEQVVSLNWVNSAFQEQIIVQEKEHFVFKEQEFTMGEEKVSISFLNAVKMLSILKGRTAGPGWLCYFTRKFAWAAMALLVLLTVAMGYFYFDYKEKGQQVNRTINGVERRIADMKKEISVRPVTTQFKPVYDFASRLYYYQQAPSFKDVINDINQGILPSAVIQTLDIDYTQKGVRAEMYGILESGFDDAYSGYQLFLQTLVKKGYSIVKNSFNTNISQSEFRLIVSKEIP